MQTLQNDFNAYRPKMVTQKPSINDVQSLYQSDSKGTPASDEKA
jgi:hypothetical protein